VDSQHRSPIMNLGFRSWEVTNLAWSLRVTNFVICLQPSVLPTPTLVFGFDTCLQSRILFCYRRSALQSWDKRNDTGLFQGAPKHDLNANPSPSKSSWDLLRRERSLSNLYSLLDNTMVSSKLSSPVSSQMSEEGVRKSFWKWCKDDAEREVRDKLLMEQPQGE